VDRPSVEETTLCNAVLVVQPIDLRIRSVKSVARCFPQKDRGGEYIQGDTNRVHLLVVDRGVNAHFSEYGV
jgi:hypothetical protein